MKVSEAKEKVCPFSIKPIPMKIEDGEVTGTAHVLMKCICGDCMAWVDTTEKEVCEGKVIKKIYPTPEPSGYCARIGQ